MKNTVAIFLLLHALIHSLGFLQAFGLTKVTPLSTPPPALTGGLWLAASILLLVAVMLWMARFPSWWMVGGVALLLSQFLIIGSWPEAKFGTLPNLILFVAIILGFAHSNFSAKNEALRNSMIAAAITPPLRDATTTNLPPPVRKWLNNSGALELDYPDWVTIRQELKMKLSPEQKAWYTAIADQIVTLDPPAFQWTVNMRMNSLAYVYGQDAFTHESGSTLMKLWGLIPVARAGGDPKTDEAALQRYLAEIVWYPIAATAPLIQWTQLDERSAEATIRLNGLIGTGTFQFNQEGEFQKFTAKRYQGTGPEAKRIPWVIEVLERGSMSGVKIPTRVAVTWVMPEGPWKWLEVRVTELRYHSEHNNG